MRVLSDISRESKAFMRDSGGIRVQDLFKTNPSAPRADAGINKAARYAAQINTDGARI
jgi:hypothetical protein